jgi:transcriptional regulator with XRE-family HTH domain
VTTRVLVSRRGGRRGKGQRRLKAHGRRTKVAELYGEGKTQQEIAKELTINQSTVSRDLCDLLTEWREHRIEIADRVKQDQYNLLLKQLDGLDRDEAGHVARQGRLEAQERELEQGWERSKGPKRQTVSEQEMRVSGAQPGARPTPTGRGKAVVKTEDQIGDPRFHEVLRGVRAELRAVGEAVSEIRIMRTRISESIRKLLGADAPAQKAWTTPTGDAAAPPAPTGAAPRTLVIVTGKDEIPRGLFLPPGKPAAPGG